MSDEDFDFLEYQTSDYQLKSIKNSIRPKKVGKKKVIGGALRSPRVTSGDVERKPKLIKKQQPKKQLSPGYDSGNSQPEIPGFKVGTLPFIKMKTDRNIKKKAVIGASLPQKEGIVSSFMKEKRISLETMLKPKRNLKARNAVLRAQKSPPAAKPAPSSTSPTPAYRMPEDKSNVVE